MQPSRTATAFRWGVAITAAVTLALRWIALSRFAVSPFYLPEAGDMRFYHDWALRILAGQWSDGAAFYGLPGYAFFLAAVYAVAGVDPFWPGVVQCFLDAAIAGLVFVLAARATAPGDEPVGPLGLIAGLLAGLGWALFVPAQTLAIILMPTTLGTLIIWSLALWFSNQTPPLATAPHPRIRAPLVPWAIAGLVAGLGTTVVATVQFVLPLAIPAALTRFGRSVAAAAAVAALAAGTVVGTAPCWAHNWLIARDPVPLSAHAGLNFFIGNNPDANGYPKMPPGMRASQVGMLRDSIRIAEIDCGRPLRRSEVSAYWAEKAWAFIGGHPLAWLRLLAVKIRNLASAFQYDDINMIAPLRDRGVTFPGPNFGMVAALALPGLALALLPATRGGPRRRARWLAGTTILYAAALLAVFITERYRLPIVPGLLAIAAADLCRFGDWVVHRRWPQAAGYAAALALAAWWVFIPQRDPALRTLEFYNSGIRALEAGDLATAAAKLERAAAEVPGNPEIQFALGNLALKSGDRALAAKRFRRTFALDPRHASAANNLAVMALEDRDPATAERLARIVLAIEPDNAKAYYLLARALAGQDDASAPGTPGTQAEQRHQAALAAARRALALRPGQKEFAALVNRLETSAAPAPPPAATPVTAP